MSLTVWQNIIVCGDSAFCSLINATSQSKQCNLLSHSTEEKRIFSLLGLMMISLCFLKTRSLHSHCLIALSAVAVRAKVGLLPRKDLKSFTLPNAWQNAALPFFPVPLQARTNKMF
jgi:hypothetical protein